MTNIYINRNATELMSYYTNLAEQGKAEVIVISKQCIGFRLASHLVK